jgi:hypothetical protein
MVLAKVPAFQQMLDRPPKTEKSFFNSRGKLGAMSTLYVGREVKISSGETGIRQPIGRILNM